MEYIHPVIQEDIASISGHYQFTKESLLNYSGRNVLYLSGHAELNSCCGRGGMIFCFVPGYVTRLRYKKNAGDTYISEIETIRDEDDRARIAALIQKSEFCQQVNFL